LHQELFRSENIAVRRLGGRGGTAIVTFGSYTNEPALDRPGFGEEFFQGEGLDAIHVINRCNRWYQHPERDDALAAVAAAVRDYDRAITYGSSMGGYAALRYAVACGADTAIAISPQFTVDPRVVPWEVRWQPDVAKTRFAEPVYAPAARQYVFYDPRVASDDQHIDLIAATGTTTRIRIPHGGHPVAALLAETGVLQAAVRGIVAGDFDPHAVRTQVRRERTASPHQYFVLASHCARRHPSIAVRLLERAAQIRPESHIVSARAVLLDRLGLPEEAAPLHRAAIRRTPNNALAWIGYAAHLEQCGEAALAARALRSAAPRQGGSMLLRVRVLQVRLWLRRHRLAWLDRSVAKLVAWSERSRWRAVILRLIGAALR
jgi:pimeloyl-ACP methyl ester carboxylesterase